MGATSGQGSRFKQHTAHMMKNIYMRCKINTNVTLIIHGFVDKKICATFVIFPA